MCGQCTARNSECVYLSKDRYETRAEALKRECEELRQSTHELQTLVDQLTKEPEDVAQATLSRLRTQRSKMDAEVSATDMDGAFSVLDDQASDQLLSSGEGELDGLTNHSSVAGLVPDETSAPRRTHTFRGRQYSATEVLPAANGAVRALVDSSSLTYGAHGFPSPQTALDQNHPPTSQLRSRGDVAPYDTGGGYIGGLQDAMFPMEFAQQSSWAWNG